MGPPVSAPISELMWRIAAWRREQGRSNVRPVSHRRVTS